MAGWAGSSGVHTTDWAYAAVSRVPTGLYDPAAIGEIAEGRADYPAAGTHCADVPGTVGAAFGEGTEAIALEKALITGVLHHRATVCA